MSPLKTQLSGNAFHMNTLTVCQQSSHLICVYYKRRIRDT